MLTHNLLSADKLLGIIKLQTDIAKLGLDLGGVMDLVVRQTQALIGATGAVVELLEDEDMVYRATAGIVKTQLGLRLKRDNSLSGLCVAQGKILRCDDSEHDERVDREACRKVGLRSMIVAPLTHLDTTIGVIKVVSSSINAFTDADEQVLALVSELIAAAMFYASKLETSELYYRATHDSLTGLANRALFFDRFRQTIAQAQRHSEFIGVLNLDMDGLKSINDQYGHRIGDMAIKEVASRIRNALRQTDTVARLGGDEFGIILSRLKNHKDAAQQSLRLTQKINMPFHIEQYSISLSASIGVAIFPEDGVEMDILLETADKSMYDIKRARKNQLNVEMA